jgi:two-component sensor histidine kinase
MVSGMLGLQDSSTTDESVRSQLRAAQARVSTIANAQRRLRLGADLSTVRADETIENAIADLRANVGDERHIRIDTRFFRSSSKAVTPFTWLSLVNELCTNAIEPASPSRPVRHWVGRVRGIGHLAA